MFRPALFAACVSLLLTGCLPVFVPLSKNNEAMPDGLCGTWTGDKVEYVVSTKEGHYEIVRKSFEEKKTPDIVYLMSISKIGDGLYATVAMDLDKVQESWPEGVKKQLELNVWPQAWIFRVQLEGDTLKFLIYDDKLAPLPQDEEPGFPSPIAADRKALRDWLAKNGDKAFKEDSSFVYKRKAVN